MADALEPDSTAAALAEELYEVGVEALQEANFDDAADALAQCMEAKASSHGEQSVEANLVAIKYAQALLGSARAKGTTGLGSMAKTVKDPNGASTSAAAAAASDDEAPGGEDDLELAWEVAEVARRAFEENAGHDAVTAEVRAETSELVADLSAERDQFDEAIVDYEKALKAVDECDTADIRWIATLHYKLSLALEMRGDVDDAMQHVNTAAAQLKFLTKQKEAERQEAEAEEAAQKAAAEDGAAPQEPASAVEGAAKETAAAAEDAPKQAPDAAEEASKEADAAEKAAAAEQGGDDAGTDEDSGEEEEAEEELSEAEQLKAEVADLKALLQEMTARQDELKSLKQQTALAKSKVQELFGAMVPGASAPAPAATATAPAAATGDAAAAKPAAGSSAEAKDGKATATVTDLGVLGSHTEKEQKQPENGNVAAPAATSSGKKRVRPTEDEPPSGPAKQHAP